MCCQAVSENIALQKNKAKDVVAAIRRLSRTPSISEDLALIGKMDDLNMKTDNLARQAANRIGHLEQMLPLAVDFWKTRENLLQFFEHLEKEIHVEVLPGATPEEVQLQQEKTKASRPI